MIDILVQPLQYEFMVRAITLSIIVGVVCSMLSCFLMVKRWSLMGDAISHSVLPGVVISYILGIPFAIGAFVFGLMSVVGIGMVKARTRIKEDAIIGIMFTSLFALGIVLVSSIPSNIDLMHILFGYVLGITNADAIQTTALGLLTIGMVLFLYKDLVLFCFDPKHARAIGINTTMLYYALLVMLALTTVAAMQTVGVILVIAMLVTPGATGYLWTNRFDYMMCISIVSGVVACVGGAYASYYLNVSTGGAIVLVQAIIFSTTLLLAPRYGILAHHRGK
jgi:manganese transport system permease protein